MTIRSRRILVIAGIGGLLISTELFAFRMLNQSMDGFAHGMGNFFQSMSAGVGFVSAASKLARQSAPVPMRFQWNWKDWQELSAEQSLRKAKITYKQKKAIAEALADQLRPICFGPEAFCVTVPTSSIGEIKSEADLQQVVLDTRVALIDLNDDGVVEVVAQGMVNCGATGNCPFWIFRKTKLGYELLPTTMKKAFIKRRAATVTIGLC